MYLYVGIVLTIFCYLTNGADDQANSLLKDLLELEQSSETKRSSDIKEDSYRDHEMRSLRELLTELAERLKDVTRMHADKNPTSNEVNQVHRSKKGHPFSHIALPWKRTVEDNSDSKKSIQGYKQPPHIALPWKREAVEEQKKDLRVRIKDELEELYKLEQL